jgi:hypothetical protein
MWLHAQPGDDRRQQMARADRALAYSGSRPGLAGAETVRAFKLDDLLDQGQGERAMQLARDWFDMALAHEDSAALPWTAQLVIDAMLATRGPAPALQLLEQLLLQIEARPTPMHIHTAGLRRHGLWLAEAVGRSDWQREQAARLPDPRALGNESSWTTRALLWLVTRGQAERATLADVERAHWLGDAEGARRAAQELLKQRPGFVVVLPRRPDSLQALHAARDGLLHDTRKAVYERYGLPVKAGS